LFQDHRFYRGGYTDGQLMIINWHPKSLSNPFQVPPQENMITFDHFPKYALPSSIYITTNANGLLLEDTRMSGVPF
jgi:hypothetical protein